MDSVILEAHHHHNAKTEKQRSTFNLFRQRVKALKVQSRGTIWSGRIDVATGRDAVAFHRRDDAGLDVHGCRYHQKDEQHFRTQEPSSLGVDP